MDCNESKHIFNFPSDVSGALKFTTGCTAGILGSKLCRACAFFIIIIFYSYFFLKYLSLSFICGSYSATAIQHHICIEIMAY